MSNAPHWREIAKALAEALESDDEAQRVRALAIYRQAAWRDDFGDLPTTEQSGNGE